MPSNQFQPILTKAGILAFTQASAAGKGVKLTHIVLGAGPGYKPTGNEKELRALRQRVSIQECTVLDSTPQIHVKAVAGNEHTEDYPIHEVGFLLEGPQHEEILFALYVTDSDRMLAYKRQDTDLLLAFDINLSLSDQPAPILVSSPSTGKGFSYPLATHEMAGIIRIATEKDVKEARDAAAALTPQNTASVFAAIEGRSKRADEDIQVLQKEISSLKPDSRELKKKIEDLSTRLNAINQETNSLKTTIEQTSKQSSAVTQKASELTSQLSSLKKSFYQGWSDAQLTSDKWWASRVTLTSFKNQLCLAYVGKDGIYVAFSNDGVQWSPENHKQITIPSKDVKTSLALSLIVWDQALFLAYVREQAIYIVKSSNGKDWEPYMEHRLYHWKTDYSTGLAVLGNTLYLAHTGTDGGGIHLSQTSTTDKKMSSQCPVIMGDWKISHAPLLEPHKATLYLICEKGVANLKSSGSWEAISFSPPPWWSMLPLASVIPFKDNWYASYIGTGGSVWFSSAGESLQWSWPLKIADWQAAHLSLCSFKDKLHLAYAGLDGRIRVTFLEQP